jgi:hypothetical protein
MKANELRIGNYVNTKEFHIPRYQGEHKYEAKWYPWVEMFKPIPLTEQWLKDFGFIWDDEQGYHKWLIDEEGSDYRIEALGWLDEKGAMVDIYGALIRCKYVHQLQNLYFALTGKELTKKQGK